MGQDVALTARDMSDMTRLAQLAANPQGTTREEIFLAVASLYRLQGTYLNDRERSLMQDILRRLARDVEMAIRISLAERLADDTSAPHDLILLLADDRIEVARPLILRSPLLTEDDVLKMIAQCGEDHHLAIAGRANIGEPVTEALSQSQSVPVLTALVLGRAIGQAGDAVKAEPAAPKAEPGEGAQKLIEKLAASGQLKAGFLLRVLHQGQIDLFDLAFARLLNIPLPEQRRKFYETGPKAVALACRAVGIDRCVFATVFNLSRQARNMRQTLSAGELAEVQAVFASFTKQAALAELRAA
jgi:uncharacterized protein (DUF2336 family)